MSDDASATAGPASPAGSGAGTITRPPSGIRPGDSRTALAAAPPRLPARCSPCPLYREAPDGRRCKSCGRGGSRTAWASAAVLAVLFAALLRFNALVLGAEFLSLQRDFRSREGLSPLRLEPLAFYCVFPVSIYEHPAQLGVLAGLLGAAMLVPLLAARLYGRLTGLAFLMLAVGLGSFPWLALSLLPGVLLMSGSGPLSRRGLAALTLSLLPVAVYTWFAVDTTRDLPTRSPVARWAAFFPAVLAVPAAILVGKMLLLAARLVGHRVWGTAPMIAGVCCVPVLIFVFGVGLSELDFSLLRQHHDPKVRFGVIPNRDKIREELLRRGVDNLDEWWDEDAPIDQLHAGQIGGLLLSRMKRETVHQCGLFLKNFPSSPHAPDVLYYRALTLDMTFDAQRFGETGAIRFDSGETTADSVPVWRRLADEHPEHPLSVPARYRVARFYVRGAEAQLRAGRAGDARIFAMISLAGLDETLQAAARVRPPPAPENKGALDALFTGFGLNPAPPYQSLVTGVAAEAEAYRDTVVCPLMARIEGE